MAIQEQHSHEFYFASIYDAEVERLKNEGELVAKNGGAGPWRELQEGDDTSKGYVHVIGEIQIVPIRLYGKSPAGNVEQSLVSGEFNLPA